MQKLLKSLGPVCAVIGAQWGDEGKGKVIDLLSEHYGVIARACGGANAGHTIVVGGQKHIFHLLPSGALHPHATVVIGSGLVLHLPTLLEEIRTLQAAGIDVLPRLYISTEAHIVFEFHKQIDIALEKQRQEREGKGIGTTKRGIGPAYMDKAARSGTRMECLKGDLRPILTAHAERVQRLYDVAVDVDAELKSLSSAQQLLSGHIVDTVTLLYEHLIQKKNVLIEGAQASLLDLDHGTYPYVTSSQTTSAGALQGLGLPPRALTSCIGVAKAYCTRVGEGDFATEVRGEQGDRLRERGGEYGSTTGRPRRCGWLSIPDLKRAAMINGFTHWNITKLDVLDEEEEIPVCAGIGADGKPEWKNLPGWRTSTVGVTEFSKLPQEAQEYIRFIEKETGVPATLIGTGPGREQMTIQ
ncbi:adenylosuccinate synthase [Candidatus Peregrinibacteria bacterium CG1_02_54_53]|nr:MAG: adenylosuccinate synthase [Candidatus Peregrinibacteria bacterium CG1_02_54_53]